MFEGPGPTMNEVDTQFSILIANYLARRVILNFPPFLVKKEKKFRSEKLRNYFFGKPGKLHQTNTLPDSQPRLWVRRTSPVRKKFFHPILRSSARGHCPWPWPRLLRIPEALYPQFSLESGQFRWSWGHFHLLTLELGFTPALTYEAPGQHLASSPSTSWESLRPVRVLSVSVAVLGKRWTKFLICHSGRFSSWFINSIEFILHAHIRE